MATHSVPFTIFAQDFTEVQQPETFEFKWEGKAITMLNIFQSFLLITVFAATSIFAQPNLNTSAGIATERYEFYSNFWINQHHFLYQKATQSNGKDWASAFDAEQLEPLNANEKAILRNAIVFYRANLIHKDLLFDDQLYWAKRALIKFNTEDELDHDAIEADHQKVLNDTKEVYRKYFWDSHNARNNQIIHEHLSLVKKIESKVLDRIAELAQQPWPREKIRVDVSYYSNWAGAYCTVNPIHAIITSDPKGPEGTWPVYGWLELVFHEPSHAVIFPGEYAVSDAIDEISKEQGIDAPRGLWHAILFYFSGIAAQEQLKSEGVDYELLMVTNDIFSTHHSAIFEHMPEYIKGEKTLEEVLTNVIKEFIN